MEMFDSDGPKAHPNTTFSREDYKFVSVDVKLDGGDDSIYCGKSQLGHILHAGDSVWGYNLRDMNIVDWESLGHQSYIPDVIIVKKWYQKRKRIWKLNRIQVEGEGKGGTEKDTNVDNFLDEIEQDRGLRKNFNLYRNEGVELKDAAGVGEEMVKVEELVKELQIN